MRCLTSLLLCVFLLSGCSQFLFYPHAKLIRTPADVGLEYRDIHFTSRDGTALHGWMLPATAQPAIASILFLHGNAENISTHIGSVHWMPERGVNVFLIDYRGYGQSTGKPTLEGVHEDAAAALSILLEQPEANGIPLVLFGQSIGGAVAIHTAATSEHRDKIEALIVEGSFSSYRKVTREALGSFWLTWPLQWPLSLTISDVYRPDHAIARLYDIPVLLIHGSQDPIVAPEHSKRLYRQANEPKTLWIIPGGRHIDAFHSLEYQERLTYYLKSLSH